VVVYSGYPGDARPRRELGALLDEGMSVDLLCLREKESEPRKEIRGSLRITRPQARRERRGKIRYFWEYGRFWLSSFWLLSVRSLYRRYDLVHVHNMPDVLVFSALVPRLLGAKIILDLHDPMPELMMTIFGLPLNHSFVRFLKLAERASMRFADRVVAVNLCCKRIFSSRSCLPEKVEVVMNTPDPQIFKFRTFHEGPARDGTRPLVIMYHGSIVERSGLDLAVEAVGIVREKIPNLELRVYGPRTPFLNRVLEKAADSPAEGLIRYMGPQSLEEIAEEITRCDVGIIPNRRNIFTELNTPIRILEYLSRGKPVIAPRAPGITDYFGEEALPFFELGDAEGLARQIEDLLLRPWEMKQLVERGQKVYLAHSWGREREQFLDLVAELLLGTVPASSPPERAATPEEEPATVST
jgi:glycosyltransferase involved in cell wall biosynthesis